MEKGLTIGCNNCNITTMKDKLTTIKIRMSTRKKLRQIAAEMDEQLLEVMDRLASQELVRLKGKVTMHLTKLYNVADEQTRRQIMDQIGQFYWDDNGGETDGPDYLIECNELAQPIEGLQTIDGTYLDGYNQDEHMELLDAMGVAWTGWQGEGYALIAASPEEIEKALISQ